MADKPLSRPAAAEPPVPWWAWAQRFEREFDAAYRALGVAAPTYEPRATGHIPEMIDLVQRLLDAGHAYVGESGNVYYNVRSLPGYGSLTNQRLEDLATASDPWRQFVAAFRFDPDTAALVEQGKGYEHLGELAAYGDAISHLTIAQTVLRAGQAINVLPSHAWLELDIRTLPGQSQDYVDSVLYDALGTDIEYTIEHLITEDATISPTEHPLYRAISAVFTDFFPDTTVVPTIAAGGSDLRFARQLGGVGYGFAVHSAERTLGEIHRQLHSHDEHLYLEELESTLTGYLALVAIFLYPSNPEAFRHP